MATAPKPKAAAGLKGRLTAKVGPLPVWAWAAVILGAFLAYQHFHGSGSGAAASTAGGSSGGTPSDAGGVAGTDGSGGLSASGDTSGGAGNGGPADNLPAYLFPQIQSQPAFQSGTNPVTGYPVGAINPSTGAPYESTYASLGATPSAIGAGMVAAPLPIAGFGKGTVTSRVSAPAPSTPLVTLTPAQTSHKEALARDATAKAQGFTTAGF